MKKKGFFLAIILFFGLAVLYLVYISYTAFEPSFLPKNLLKVVDVTIASIPGLPKTPRQILTKTALAMGQVQLGHQSFDLILADKATNKKFLEILVTGPFVYKDGRIDLKTDLSLSTDPQKSKPKVVLSGLDLNRVVYLKSATTAAFGGYSLAPLNKEWLRLSLKEVEGSLSVSTLTDAQIQSDVRKQLTAIEEALLKAPEFKNTGATTTQERNGIESYHFSKRFSKDELLSLSKVLEEKASQSLINELSLEMWVDKKTSLINEVLLSGQLPKGLLSGVSGYAPADYEFTLAFKFDKKSLDLAGPTQAREVSLVQLKDLVNASKKNENPFTYSESLIDFGTNILTAEKLLHALYLLSLSF